MKKILLLLFVCIAIKAIGQEPKTLREHFKGEKQLTLPEEVYQKFNQLKKEKSITAKTTAGNQSIEELVLFWNNNGWNDTIHKTEYIIDGMDRLVTWYHYIYDNGQFDYFRRIEYTYDQSGNNTVFEIIGYNPVTASWYQFSRETKKFDSYNNVTERKLELYTAGQWNVDFIAGYQYQYNANGQITEKIETAKFNNTPTKFIEKEEILYDAAGKDSMYIYYQYDTTLTAWVPFEKIHEIVWSGNNITDAEYQFYLNGIWKNYNKVELEYDSLDQEILQIIYQWDTTNLTWESMVKNTSSYFQNGDLDTMAMYQWTGTYWILSDGEKFTYTYNAADDLISRERQIYEINLQSWVKTLKHIYNYSIVAGINNSPMSGSEIVVYPNPAKDHLIISGLGTNEFNAMIFDMNGRLIADHKLNSNEAMIDLTDIQNGFYFIQLKGNEVLKTIKIVKN